jgi:receptor protein-tyrosine kinase
MESERAWDGASSLRDYLRVLMMRKMIVLVAAVLTPAVAIAVSLNQESLYTASADVFVKRQTLAATLSGIPDPYEDPERFVQTQVGLARVPELARRVLEQAGARDKQVGQFLSRSEVLSKPGTDLLTFTVTDPNPALAVRLATVYGREFTRYRLQLDTEAVKRARTQVAGQIQRLGAPSRQRAALARTYAALFEREGQLRTMEALQTSNAALVHPADEARKTRPKPVRAGILGLGLGIFFGVGLAFLRHALDTRVHSAEEIGERLGLAMLGRVPVLPRHLRRGDRVAMLAEPHGFVAEAYRMLRTNLDFMNLELAARSIVFTSAVEGEGKSTTVVNLGASLALTGRRVVVVDLDLRRPFLHHFFNIENQPGLTQVALGHVTLEQAIVSVALTESTGPPTEQNGNHGAVTGALEVLVAGPVPPDPGEFVGSRSLERILGELSDRADLILIDSPPLLHVGDAMILSSRADALVLVTRLAVLRRQMIRELQRLLATCPARKLGFVLNGARGGAEYGGYHYTYSSRYSGGRAPERVT